VAPPAYRAEPELPDYAAQPEAPVPPLPAEFAPPSFAPPSMVVQTSMPSLGTPPISQLEAPVADQPDVAGFDDSATPADDWPGHDVPPRFDQPTPEPAPEPEPEPEPTAPLQPAADLSVAIVEQVSFGDDVIQVQIAIAPSEAAPLAWTPMPYDVPQDGVAYVCLGASDKGCLFVDLGRAPGPVAIGGDSDAAARLVESIAFQLSAALEPDRASVTVVGDIGKSMELGQVDRTSTLGQIVSRGSTLPEGAEPPLELLICSRDTARDETALAWLTSDRSRRIVPIVIGSLPTAPWSLTAGRVQHNDAPVTHRQEAAGISS
jgi:hypothetical protein